MEAVKKTFSAADVDRLLLKMVRPKLVALETGKSLTSIYARAKRLGLEPVWLNRREREQIQKTRIHL